MNNLAPLNEPIEAYKMPSKECACRIELSANGMARQLLQQWLKDHPVHIRKEHLNAKEFCEWFDRQLNGRRQGVDQDE